jgi:hypothetical protein
MHFEKAAKDRPPFRVVEQHGKRLELRLGRASEEPASVKLSFRSAAEAARAGEKWAHRFRCAGFSGFEIPKGCAPGIVYSVQGPGGPGRVRVDGSEDVLYPAGTAEGLKLKVGLRVMVEGIRTASGRPPDFMFGSKRVAKRLLPFPKPVLSPIVVPELRASVRRELAALAGPGLNGHQRFPEKLRGAKPGDLIFSYEKGVHRFICAKPAADVDEIVYYEPLFTSDFKLQSGWVLQCIRDFCAPLPPKLVARLERLAPDFV